MSSLFTRQRIVQFVIRTQIKIFFQEDLGPRFLREPQPFPHVVQIDDVVIGETIVIMAMLKGRIQLLLEFRERLADSLEELTVVIGGQMSHRIAFEERDKVEGGVHGGVYNMFIIFLYITFN